MSTGALTGVTLDPSGSGLPNDYLNLEIGDQGVGFDEAKTKNGGGLGLVSMAERIYQVNGTFEIDSQPNAGTRIRARVPVAAHSKAMATAAN